MRRVFIGLTLIGFTGLLQGCGSGSPNPTGSTVVTVCETPNGPISVTCAPTAPKTTSTATSGAPAAEIPKSDMGAENDGAMAAANDDAIGAIP